MQAGSNFNFPELYLMREEIFFSRPSNAENIYEAVKEGGGNEGKSFFKLSIVFSKVLIALLTIRMQSNIISVPLSEMLHQFYQIHDIPVGIHSK
ncbi:hypothetical protein CDAR_498041 [Caerostris darwini]|uniref:Uncharacterized protein n=1 Tax=Caerostris darwini TaxID=1538125 RepID=A0AAV4X4E8_9ARAC|nr:hypothetical protein CDAR_498041 [Caerostris darwini]